MSLGCMEGMRGESFTKLGEAPGQVSKSVSLSGEALPGDGSGSLRREPHLSAQPWGQLYLVAKLCPSLTSGGKKALCLLAASLERCTAPAHRDWVF